MSVENAILQRLPSVHSLLQTDAIGSLIRDYSRELVLEEVQLYLDELREQIRRGTLSEEKLLALLPDLDSGVRTRLQHRLRPSLIKVINATGVIIHTNLGRAPLPVESTEAMAELWTGYSNLEYDLDRGARGHRDVHFEKRLRRLLGCQAATVCNNNAAAVLLILNTLARGKKVLVSRGELVEIGGSFRIPAIMERSGALLEEVGTTNKTRLSDYREAIDDQTGLILRVHPSNYKIVGFTQQADLGGLVELAREKNVPLVEDAGSGLLFPSQQDFLQGEPSVQTLLRQGVDLICFSGDKLLGGPQSGIVVGRQELVDDIRKNPLMRACRVDKTTYAALEWILVQYETGQAQQTVPVQQMLMLGPESIQQRALQLSDLLDPGVFSTEIRPGFSLIGGGAAPEEQIPSILLAVSSSRHSVNRLERGLRESSTPILARIEDDRLILDLRTVLPHQDRIIASALMRMAEN